MIIGIDLDGTLCTEEKTFERPLAKVMVGAADYLRKLRDEGHVLIVWTARGWEQYRVTHSWLVAQGIPFDVLLMGKPIVDIWIDDRAIAFDSWTQVAHEIQQRNSRR